MHRGWTHWSGKRWCAQTFTWTPHLTLSGLHIFPNGLKQPFTQFRNQTFVRPVAHHRVTLSWAGLPIGQQCGIVTLQQLYQPIRTDLNPQNGSRTCLGSKKKNKTLGFVTYTHQSHPLTDKVDDSDYDYSTMLYWRILSHDIDVDVLWPIKPTQTWFQTKHQPQMTTALLDYNVSGASDGEQITILGQLDSLSPLTHWQQFLYSGSTHCPSGDPVSLGCVDVMGSVLDLQGQMVLSTVIHMNVRI